MNHQIGLIGGGNMAQAIIAGLLKSGRSSSDILVSDPNQDCRKALAEMGITSFADSTPVMAQADLIVLAVKPQIMDNVLTTLSDSLRATQVIISIAAGITIHTIRRQLNDAKNPVVRVMPNTPALIGEGMSALASDRALSGDIKIAVQEIFDACGQALWVSSEDAVDAVTAVSGSGPAYFFLMIENLINTGVRLGLSPEIARALVIHAGQIGTGLGLSLNSPLSETLGLAADFELVDATGVTAHFSRITTGSSVARIREAKAKGLQITCDVTLAHLLYSEKALADLDPNFHLERPLRTEDDRLALIAGVADGTIDLIVSDHSPHETGAKLAPFPETERGMSLVEGAIQLLFQLDQKGELGFEQSISAMTVKAAQVANQQQLGSVQYGHSADCVLFDPNGSTGFDASHWLSAGTNSPLFGHTLSGHIVGCWINGRRITT